MVHISAAVILACSLVAFASPLAKTTVAQIEADLAVVQSDVNALDASINAFPNSGGTLAQVLAIHSAVLSLASALNQGTTDSKATGGPVGEDDGNTVISVVEAIEPVMTDALNAVAAKKAAFDALDASISPLVKADLQTLSDDTSAFQVALVSIAPADLMPRANVLVDEFNAAFSTALAAYADA